MGLLHLNNTMRRNLLFSNPLNKIDLFFKNTSPFKFGSFSLCSAKDAIFTCSSPPLIEPTYQFPVFLSNSCLGNQKLRFLGTPCLNSVQRALPLNEIIAYRATERRFSSGIVGLDENSDGGIGIDFDNNNNNNGKESDLDMMYKAIMDNSHAYSNMEKALEQVGVPLTTELVVEVLHRLRYEEKLAFRFFTWAGHQENYDHETRVYNDMIDILSCTKYKVKQFRIVCDLLDYMKRHEKKTVPFEVLLTVLRQYTEKHLTYLQKFLKKKKIRVKTQPEINAFNLLLDALCKCSLVEDAERMFKRVRTKIKPDSNTFNILFFGWCRVRNPTRGMKILEEMIELGHTPDNFTYNTAIDTFCKAGMVTEAVELFEFMRTKGSTMSSPTAKTYAIMIVALIENDRIDESFKFLGYMISSGCLPDVSTYKELIEGMCLPGKVDAAYKFLEMMGNKGYPPDIVTYNCFLKVLCDNKQSDEALRLYGGMIGAGCMPSVQTYNMLISMYFEIGDVDGVFDTWHEMDKKHCIRDSDTYCVMIEGLFSCNKVDEACSLLEDVVNKGIKFPYRKFDSFLMLLSENGDLRAIHRLSDHMRKFYNPAMERRFALSQKRKSMRLREK